MKHDESPPQGFGGSIPTGRCRSAPRFAFCASTGRTATMFLAATLDSLPDVVGLHEGQTPGNPPTPRLPLINLHNRKAWHDPAYAEQTVARMRERETLSCAARDASLLIDVAFYNSPLLVPLTRLHRESTAIVVFRRCEAFVRSATIVHGEDRQPAGWPDRAKPQTDRERFIALGRLRPAPATEDGKLWPEWSAIQRNVWLWHHVNSHLLRVVRSDANCHALHYERLVSHPEAFWSALLRELDLLSTSNLAHCASRSAKKLNQRSRYDIGPSDTWSDPERSMYERLALPLEKELYD